MGTGGADILISTISEKITEASVSWHPIDQLFRQSPELFL